jgi:hypothetical protein
MNNDIALYFLRMGASGAKARSGITIRAKPIGD